MAVRVGFEPTEPVKVQRFSRPPDSTALAPHRIGFSLVSHKLQRLSPRGVTHDRFRSRLRFIALFSCSDWIKRDHDTFCVSCHTSAPYGIGRSALRTALGEKERSAGEHKVLDNIARRVRMGGEVAPFYPDSEKSPGKTPESRGT